MKAVVFREYGSPSNLKIEDVEKPIPGDGEVLVKVRAVAANPMDYHLMSGLYLLRLKNGLRRPKPTRMGADWAGVVEETGKNVTLVKPGDEVIGAARGAFAEYVCAAENKLGLKPANISFEEAAAIPVAGLTALNAVRDKGRVQPGQKVLINGASGGVGTFAVQIAKSYGAIVTGVCSTKNLELVRSIGADHVIDYTREDFTRSTTRYDVIIDCIGNHPVSECLRVITRQGILVAVGVRAGGRVIGPIPYLLSVLVASLVAKQKVVICMAKITPADLGVMRELIESGKVKPVIDRCYKLDEVAEAIAYLKRGHASGKVVMTVTTTDRFDA